ncbi:MAG TPA: nickel-responsive transcriptional regulator NikR [Casimicrobiaceae bacterium]|nr:nickel-responsive transcriptional regulator NikR [Casimicrobiaceae bacterium]
MQRITMSIEDGLAREFDLLRKRRGYTNRSEAMRDLLRREVEAHRSHEQGYCVATLSYVYNHHARNLAERLADAQHAHHDLVTATMHVHLDHAHCLETVVLKGLTASVRAFADSLLAERGVHHGYLNVVTVETSDEHKDGAVHHHRGRLHLIPRS